MFILLKQILIFHNLNNTQANKSIAPVSQKLLLRHLHRTLYSMRRMGRCGFLGISKGQARAGTVPQVHPDLVGDALARSPIELEGLPGQGAQGDGEAGRQRALQSA